MDSLIQRFSSSKWPIMMQAQRRATKRFMETTEAWSEVITVVSFSYKPPTAILIVAIKIRFQNRHQKYNVKLNPLPTTSNSNQNHVYGPSHALMLPQPFTFHLNSQLCQINQTIKTPFSFINVISYLVYL